MKFVVMGWLAPAARMMSRSITNSSSSASDVNRRKSSSAAGLWIYGATRGSGTSSKRP